ncbi:hypothetical protein Q0590_10005 [Rhodocytophaga aerolata]|uniref:Uncharacterized protein n=1 Tax=Rhodocytophaga aerolata TaxID=455078 RepID=A0ABT8R3S5_9BACT|nr:hypothetical protein [Rhodocytophaga aerolata]MDO1446584.1 hypothetical protein [Rhodocytophaga aerolata]
MEKAIQLAGLLGPILVVLSISEGLNLHIWERVEANLVYLNGLLLFVGGLSIVRTYNYWALDWPMMITLTGWLSLMAGLYRMFFPNARQLKKSTFTYVVLLLLLVTGIILTYKGYFD